MTNAYDPDVASNAEELISNPDLFSTRDDLMQFLVACGWPRPKVGRMVGVSGGANATHDDAGESSVDP